MPAPLLFLIFQKMKKIFTLLACTICIIAAGCTKSDSQGQKEEEKQPQIEWKETFNGKLVIALAGAYDQWESTGKLPTCVKWEGIDIFFNHQMRAGITLAVKMLDEPDGWFKKDISYPTATCSSTTADEPFLPSVIPFAEFEQTLRTQNRNMLEKGAIDLYSQVAQYEPKLSSAALLTMICRAMAAWRDNGRFPENIYTWESSYTHSTNNCDITAAEVKEARDAAWQKAGVTESSTERQKAEAIFNYARDQWTWEDYYNTKKGAVGTIKTKGGNCCDLSHAVCAMARLSGIPARYFHAQCNYSSGVIGHVISQLFVDGQWYYADASNDSNTFGTVVFKGYTGLHYYESLEF